MMGREGKEKLTATANSGIGSGNLYSAAVQMWVGKEEEEEGSVRVGERRGGAEGLLEKKDSGREGLWKEKKRGGRRLKEGDVVHAMFICCCSGLGRT